MRTDRNSPGDQEAEGQAHPPPRIDLDAVGGGESLHALRGFAKSSSSETLDANLIQLVRVRVLQLIGGALGERQGKAIAGAYRDLGRKIACLPDWYTSRVFSARERAALMWAEDIVYADRGGLSDTAYADAAKEFTPGELWALATAVAATCAWTQIAQAFRLTDLGLSS